MIQQGRRTWQSPVRDLQHEMLRPWDQLPPPKSQNKSGNNQVSSISVCNNWNYKDNCNRTDCSYQYVCKECKKIGIIEKGHKAKTCPRLFTDNSNQ